MTEKDTLKKWDNWSKTKKGYCPARKDFCVWFNDESGLCMSRFYCMYMGCVK
jgi:hypothetical protein